MIDSLRVTGITGPTGAGKTPVSAVFGEEGFYVVDTDLLSRRVTQPGSPCLTELAAEFSGDILDKNGCLNRSALAGIVFKDKSAAARLNDIIHPYIIALSEEILAQKAKKGVRAAVLDGALLFESGADRLCDDTIAVVARPDIRLARITGRDGIDIESARDRISAQQPEEYYTGRAGYVLDGNAAAADLREQARALAREILSKSGEGSYA